MQETKTTSILKNRGLLKLVSELKSAAENPEVVSFFGWRSSLKLILRVIIQFS